MIWWSIKKQAKKSKRLRLHDEKKYLEGKYIMKQQKNMK